MRHPVHSGGAQARLLHRSRAVARQALRAARRPHRQLQPIAVSRGAVGAECRVCALPPCSRGGARGRGGASTGEHLFAGEAERLPHAAGDGRRARARPVLDYVDDLLRDAEERVGLQPSLGRVVSSISPYAV